MARHILLLRRRKRRALLQKMSRFCCVGKNGASSMTAIALDRSRPDHLIRSEHHAVDKPASTIVNRNR
jgi:hypothetical protein